MFSPSPSNQSLSSLSPAATALRKQSRTRFHNRHPASSPIAEFPASQLRYSAVYIVDSHSQDYAAVATGLESEDQTGSGERNERVRVKVFNTASQALKIPRYEAPLFFVVNVNLPDLCGFELRELLTERWPAAPGYLISDEYDPANEIKARCSGATLYFCKPLEPGWLAAALHS